MGNALLVYTTATNHHHHSFQSLPQSTSQHINNTYYTNLPLHPTTTLTNYLILLSLPLHTTTPYNHYPIYLHPLPLPSTIHYIPLLSAPTTSSCFLSHHILPPNRAPSTTIINSSYSTFNRIGENTSCQVEITQRYGY